MDYIFSQHALEQMSKRDIPKETVENILRNPDQKALQADLTVFQSIERSESSEFLIRVFVNLRKSPPLVVTVYKTSKIDKYYEGKI
ncbi:MAG: DUF4258 domain-containing protein [Bacteroidetes bacterium]|nr:DUF4258 domain-containing protein [Bacteroidota bacterium]